MFINMPTKRGDSGKTCGECFLTVSKDSVFVRAVGSIDSLQASLGLFRVVAKNDNKKIILQIEKDLSEIMGSLFMNQKWLKIEEKIEEVNTEAEKIKKEIGKVEKFLIPGENEIEARVNKCRTDCRETEVRVVALKADKKILKYFNRLSYLLNWIWRSSF